MAMAVISLISVTVCAVFGLLLGYYNAPFSILALMNIVGSFVFLNLLTAYIAKEFNLSRNIIADSFPLSSQLLLSSAIALTVIRLGYLSIVPFSIILWQRRDAFRSVVNQVKPILFRKKIS
jgi:cellulose synthase/poly-beta-1,6-N-acetylglucosamine synthase-like glycosyltransferase